MGCRVLPPAPGANLPAPRGGGHGEATAPAPHQRGLRGDATVRGERGRVAGGQRGGGHRAETATRQHHGVLRESQSAEGSAGAVCCPSADIIKPKIIMPFSFFGNLAAYQTWVLGVRLRSAFPSRPYQTRVLLLTLTLYILCKENAPKPSLKARAGDNKCNTRNVTFRFDRGRAAGTIKYRPGATQPIIIYYTLPGIYMFEIQPISRRDPSTPPIPVVSP